ncbi:hypothetical protein [Brevundimonas sp.]|uniref:hypothetical protein n=1 Tax=Brevundimonas sp. TaxID=1871086 RepID=UPI00260203AC|nr:hypothetical protein [Brevundimonas sp.]
MRRSITVLLALSGLAACAPTEGGAQGSQLATRDGGVRQCFEPGRVINFRQGEQQRLYLRVLGGGVFQVGSSGCFDLGSANAIAISPSAGINDRLCVGDGARIASLGPSSLPGPCFARIERSLTEAEIEALPGRQRP